MAVTVTATEQDTWPPRVLVDVSGLTPGDGVEVYREVAGVRQLVRGGATLAGDPVVLRTDAELPFGVPVSYVAVVNGFTEYRSGTRPALNTNPTFETGVAPWVAYGGTRQQSTAWAREGAASMLLTPDFVTETARVESEQVPGTPGVPYQSEAWLRCAVTRTARLSFNWYSATGVYQSTTTGPTLALTANVPAYITFTATMPAGAGRQTLNVSMNGTPLSSHLLNIDEARLYAAGTLPLPVTYTLPGGVVALSDAITGQAAEVVILAWPDRTRSRDSSVFRVGTRSVAVLGPLAGAESTVELLTETTTARDQLVALLEQATEGVVQVRQPGGYDGVDGYLAVLDAVERRWSQDGTDQRRVTAVSVVEVEGWAAALEARGTALADVADAYPSPPLTLADVAAAYPTLAELARADLS